MLKDAKRWKNFPKISRDLYMAAKSGGPDPDANPQLRLVMEKARAANMPKIISNVPLIKLLVQMVLTTKRSLMKVMVQLEWLS